MVFHSFKQSIIFTSFLCFCVCAICVTEEAQDAEQPSTQKEPPKYSGNPLLQGKGVCDPSVRIFNNRAYLYATHDTPLNAPDRKGKQGFHMLEWWVWSSADLVDWELEGTLSPTVFGAPEGFSDCWATDALSKDGKYFWYVCTPRNTYVAVSKTPNGPWQSPLGNRPLMAGRDPAPFIDDDGTAYLVTGVWNFNIARLGDDLISLAEKPCKIVINNPEGPYGKGKTDDKAYLHKRNDWYYLSWGCYYAMSKNVYGPYDCKGSFLNREDIDPQIRQKDWNYDRHGSFFQWRGQWYFICNNKKASGGYYRNSVICYVQYKDNGEIAPVRITAKGVREVGLDK